MAFIGETLRQFIAGSPKLGEYKNTQWAQWEAIRVACEAEAQANNIVPAFVGAEKETGHKEVRGHFSDCIAQISDRWRCGDGRYRNLLELIDQVELYCDAFAKVPPKQSPSPAPKPTPVPSSSTSPDRLWTGRWDSAAKAVGGKSDATSTYGNVQFERAGGSIQNSPSAPRVPVVEHPLLGSCLRLSLDSGVKRHEVSAAGNADSGWDPGTERWCAFSFVLDSKFPLSSSNPWNIISQVHQSSGSGSPPLEFDARSNALRIRGNSRGYDVKVCDLVVNERYDIIFGLQLGRSASGSIINVLVNGEHLIRNFRAPIDFGSGCYWKVASAYADPKIGNRPIANFQRDHRIGRTLASVR